jgi:hypothetical protein
MAMMMMTQAGVQKRGTATKSQTRPRNIPCQKMIIGGHQHHQTILAQLQEQHQADHHILAQVQHQADHHILAQVQEQHHMDRHVLAQAQEQLQNRRRHTHIMETKIMMTPQNPSRDHHSKARKFLWEDYPREASRLTRARTHYRDKETTMVEAMTTEATGMILSMTMGMDEDTVETVETEGATTVETEEEVEMTVVEMVVETTLTPQSKRRSTTSRKGQNVTRTNIPNTRTSDTGTHSSLR